jgi:hypothetical protein
MEELSQIPQKRQNNNNSNKNLTSTPQAPTGGVEENINNPVR